MRSMPRSGSRRILPRAAGQFTPRVVRIYTESWVTKTTLAVFLCTFLYTLRVQKEYASGNDTNDPVVPYIGASLAMGFLVASLVLFVFYVNSTVRLMRVTHVMDRVTHESLRTIATSAHPQYADETPEHAEPATPELHTSDLANATPIPHTGNPGVLQAVHTQRIVRQARQQGRILHLVPKVGDYICPGEALFLACTGPALTPREQRSLVDIGVERTTEQDLGFGLRQLADIAVHALSPAVNDPTTALQALDHIQVLLTELAQRPSASSSTVMSPARPA